LFGDTTTCPLRTAPSILADLTRIVNAGRGSLGEKAEHLPHHALSLIGLEKKLSVGRAIQNDEFFGFGSFLVLFANPGEARSIFAGVVACHDEQRGRLELAGGAAGRRAEKYQAIDFTRLRGD